MSTVACCAQPKSCLAHWLAVSSICRDGWAETSSDLHHAAMSANDTWKHFNRECSSCQKSARSCTRLKGAARTLLHPPAAPQSTMQHQRSPSNWNERTEMQMVPAKPSTTFARMTDAWRLQLLQLKGARSRGALLKKAVGMHGMLPEEDLNGIISTHMLLSLNIPAPR